MNDKTLHWSQKLENALISAADFIMSFKKTLTIFILIQDVIGISLEIIQVKIIT